jgi:cholesterol transport system auxiliary component
MIDRIPLEPDRRSLLTIVGASFALAACGAASNLIGPPEAPQIYVLRPVVGDLSGPKVTWALAVDRPDAADNLDIARIAISRSANTQDYYANASWPDKLPNLVQSALVETLEKSGRIEQVAGDTAGVRTDYLLQTEIRQFEARYDQPDGAPTVVVRIAARLIARDRHTIVARTVSTREIAATQNSIDAAVVAFNAALGDVIAQIAGWTLNASPLPVERKPRR